MYLGGLRSQSCISASQLQPEQPLSLQDVMAQPTTILVIIIYHPHCFEQVFRKRVQHGNGWALMDPFNIQQPKG